MRAAMVELPKGARGVRQPQGYTIWTVGDERAVLRDYFHRFLRTSWPRAIAWIAAGFLAVNLVFAAVYVAVDGVEGARAGSYWDAFVFSVQTLGTIGYGVMHPYSTAANVVVISESITGIIVIAIVTGLVFTKFARATARLAFTTDMVITSHEGKPTLLFRLGNRRANVIVEARLTAILSLTRLTPEGETFYKLHDLKLVRDRMAGMRRGWVAMHVIDETSPLHGMDAAALAKAEAEVEISLTGLDDVTMQTVHSIHVYSDEHIKFGRRFADTLRALPSGDVVLDLTQFDVTVPDDVPRDSVAA